MLVALWLLAGEGTDDGGMDGGRRAVWRSIERRPALLRSKD